jgi:hypothetical protein
MVYSKVLACLHIGSPSFPHDLIYCFMCLLFILFYFICILFFIFYPFITRIFISYFLFTLLDRVLQVRCSGRTAYMFLAEGYVCVICAFLCVYVCVCVCVSVMYCHTFFIMCERAERERE